MEHEPKERKIEGLKNEPNRNITPTDPAYSWWAQAEQDRRANARKWANERMKRMRNRLSALLAMSHGAVEAALHSERDSRVRKEVKGELQRRYGAVKRPTPWNT
jgi:hypothetical protein